MLNAPKVATLLKLSSFELCKYKGWIQSSSSDLQKSFKYFETCVCYYPSCFSVYYEIKQKKNVESCYTVDYAANPGLPERIRRVSVRVVSSEKIRRHNRKKFVSRGWDWMVNGSFHKSLKTLFYWPQTLTLSCELLKLGCDWLSRPKTTVETTDNRI